MPKGRTLAQSFSLEGVGIHSGEPSSITCHPSTEEGIRFRLTYIEGGPVIPVSPTTFVCARRASSFTDGTHSVFTPEHILSAVYGCGITHLDIDISGPELPILDGSALPFVQAIHGVGFRDLDDTVSGVTISKEDICEEGPAKIIVMPSETLRFTYILHYPQSHLGIQIVTFDASTLEYATGVAPARTFALEEEVAQIKALGLGKGGSLDNTVIVTAEGYLNDELRFKDECVRHKLLDMIGDLGVLGAVNGHFIGVGSGHDLNIKLVHKLASTALL